jgi:hypothetical protein
MYVRIRLAVMPVMATAVRADQLIYQARKKWD